MEDARYRGRTRPLPHWDVRQVPALPARQPVAKRAEEQPGLGAVERKVRTDRPTVCEVVQSTRQKCSRSARRRRTTGMDDYLVVKLTRPDLTAKTPLHRTLSNLQPRG
jgi:hypothetical protein